MAKKRILIQDEIDRYMNNLDELSELSEDGFQYSDEDVDFYLIVCFAYKLEIYSGQENNEKYRQNGEPDLEQMFNTKRCKRTAESVPCKDIRRDGIIIGQYGQKSEYSASFQTARATLKPRAKSLK
ncbi:hypothetical protein TNIN_330671 [Trichonephila inaurata madagascariensis]|uniref:Uncharacterized protein n=1 Tax=Trichonephila inaurata madagascariensis TaxID=2747483 RepID=A0A8X6XV09_9ARAC|nr:hypothetical protein TNIN_330671 [Trichonephila inaurata madagascariensis]